MIKRKIVLMLIIGGGLLASCSNDDDETTANGVATSLIANSTCNTNTPRDINNTNFSDDDSQVDVNALTPGCTLPGG